MVSMSMESQAPHPEMDIAPEIEIKASEVDTERLGIWCKLKIEAGSKFGPFLGQRVLEGTDDMDPSFVWEIVDLDTKEFICYINASEPKSGNWMRYINCARYFEEQNIVSEQEGIDIFYRAIKDIEPGEELLTWYEKAPFRKKRGGGKRIKKDKVATASAKTSRSDSPESRTSVAGDVPESLSPTFLEEDDMHTSQRGRRRKVTKYWEMENLENSENSDFQRESDINSEDDMTIASDDDWNASSSNFNKLADSHEMDQPESGSSEYFQFEVRPYHIVKSWLGRKVFKCEICSGVYRHSFSLKRHFIRNHINYKFVSKTDLLNCQISYKEGQGSEQVNTTEEQDGIELDDEAKISGENDGSEAMDKPEKVDEKLSTNGTDNGEEPPSSPKSVGSTCGKEGGCKGKSSKDHEDGEDENESKAANKVAQQSNEVEKSGKEETEDCKPKKKEATSEEAGPEAEDDSTRSSTGDSASRSTPTSSTPSDDISNTDLKDLDEDDQAAAQDVTDGNKTSQTESKVAKDVGPSLTGVKMTGLYRCNVCEKLFDTVYDLKEHLSNHPESSSKAFACDKCDMKFTHKQNLMRHTAVHTGARPFICKYCGKKFPTITNQKRHERIHQGRRFSCDHCASTFSQTGDLKKHVRKLHPELFNECGFCAKYFASTELLQEHLLESHGEDIDANTKEISIRKEAFKVDLESDRAESMRLAIQRGLAQNKQQFRFACTVCKKKFLDYANMCRHRRLAHQRHMLHLGAVKKENSEVNHAHSPLRSLFDPDMDRNSAFYAKVSKNIADNLKYHLEGTQEEIKMGCAFIRWKEKEDKELDKSADVKVEKWEHYNFPQGFAPKDQTKLISQKVPMSEYLESSGMASLELSRPVISEKVDGSSEETKCPNEPPDNASPNAQSEGIKYSRSNSVPTQQRPTEVLSPPALSRQTDLPSSPHPTPPDSPAMLSPPRPLTIKVPEMKLCKICHCVFHNSDVFRDHMMKKHRIIVAPPLLERQGPASAPPTLTSPPAHQHLKSKFILPPPLIPGVNPNRIRSLVISPHLYPPAAHQHSKDKQLSPAPPKLSPMLPPSLLSPPNHTHSEVTTPTVQTPVSDVPPDPPSLTIDTDPKDVPSNPHSPKPQTSKVLETKAKPVDGKSDDREDPSKQVTGEDPNPEPRKYVCLVCYGEFKTPELLSGHQEEKHRNVQCKSVAVDLSFMTTWYTTPLPVGMLNVSACQIPTKAEGPSQKYACTKCRKLFGSSGDLHSHILDCGDYGRNAPPLAYIWYLRGQVITPKKSGHGKKTGHGKFRRGRNLSPQKKKSSESQQKANELSREEAQLLAQRRILERQMSADSPDEDPGEFGRRRRRRLQELSYNPHNHVRRRDLADLLGNKCLGCGETFDIISMLERHIPMCPDKEKIRGTAPASTKQPAQEAADSDNDFDPNKHMCIYCEKQFTYLGMLRKHILDVCTVRKDLVEKDEYIDDEWELDLDIRTGHATSKRTLSRQSSMSSLNGILGEEGENSQDSFDNRPRRRRKRRGHNWGYKPKGSKKRPEDEETPYMLEHSFFADNDSSNSRVASIGEDESSNDSSAMALGTTAADMVVPARTDQLQSVKSEVGEGMVGKGDKASSKDDEGKQENMKPASDLVKQEGNKPAAKKKADKQGENDKSKKKKKKGDNAKTDSTSQTIKEKLAKKIKEGTKKPKQKNILENSALENEKDQKSGTESTKQVKSKSSAAEDKSTKVKNQGDTKSPANKSSGVKSKVVESIPEQKGAEPKTGSKKQKVKPRPQNKARKENEGQKDDEELVHTEDVSKPSSGGAEAKKQPAESQKASRKSKGGKMVQELAESSDEDDVKLSDLKVSFCSEEPEEMNEEETNAGDKEGEPEEEEEEEEEEEVEESVPKKRRRRGPRLTMKRRKTSSGVSRLASPEPVKEEEKVTLCDQEMVLKDVSPDRSSRDMSPTTRLQAKTSEAIKRDVSPASISKSDVSDAGKRDVSPGSKSSNKRKRKLCEVDANGEDSVLMGDLPDESKVQSGKSKKVQKSFHTRSKSSPGPETVSKSAKSVDTAVKGRGGRKSDSSLGGGVQVKTTVGKGAAAGRKSTG